MALNLHIIRRKIPFNTTQNLKYYLQETPITITGAEVEQQFGAKVAALVYNAEPDYDELPQMTCRN
ncbi:hypothetical protein TGAMA5MH_09515 [Trichoderma gamsii]|uniref:Uncharacterized protein n=1 Tax=Trichoderma gamsii TaxID=398673 RepID=A0A2K0SYT2_9HYPO|nr:hypothetical protein TGAMA5MH_09515 [Trichoderma gamsii]